MSNRSDISGREKGHLKPTPEENAAMADLKKQVEAEKTLVASREADPVVTAAMKENHRSGPSYQDLKAMWEEEKQRAEKMGEQLNAIRLVINNPMYRYGPYVEAEPVGKALELAKVWQPKASR